MPSPRISSLSPLLLEEVCLPSFDVLNCSLNLVASCLDEILLDGGDFYYKSTKNIYTNTVIYNSQEKRKTRVAYI